MKSIRKAAVIGAGTMGSGIAAHFANAGVPCVLLDIIPPSLKEVERGNPQARSRLAIEAIKRQAEEKPGGFFDAAGAPLVEPGNIEDHLEKLRDCDWIVEAVTEKIDLKKSLYQKIAPFRRPDAIISSNTSGIALKILTEGMDAGFRQHFLITHFFNPPRYLYLLEVVPGGDTLPEVLETVETFAEIRLGKGVVRCKDTPNFIANRIGVYAMASCARLTEELGLTFEEVDAITGSPLGRPKTASYRLQDLVGIDVSYFVMENVAKLLPYDESRDLFKPTELFTRMVKEGRLGRKTGAGFYKKEGKDILVLDARTFQYRPQKPVSFPSLEALKGEKSAGPRIKKLIEGSDAAARFAWKHLSGTLCYSARRIPEIADDVVAIDRALRWGFVWELGPFEIWDAIGVRESVERMKKEGLQVPPLVTDMLASGRESFYGREGAKKTAFDFPSRKPKPIPGRPGVLLLADVRAAGQPIKSNRCASLWDLGDGVLGVEFHSKMNSISAETLEMIFQAIDEAERGGWAGAVVGNQAEHFSVGANLVELSAAAKEKRFDLIDGMIRNFHRTVLRMRYAAKPVVTATHGYTFGGGCEIAMAGHRIQAAAETYFGLVELGVGLIPAGGGTRELACRAHEAVPLSVGADIFPFVRRAFETIGQAKSSSSAAEARPLGFLLDRDAITMNRDRVLADAKRAVLFLAEQGFQPPRRRDAVRVAGKPGLAEFEIAMHQFRQAGYVSDYDVHLGKSLAQVLCGGEVDDTDTVTEEYLLDLEREVFLKLCGEPKTLDRIEYMLRNGKPLRN
ncbi:MAG: 3-hydroxyacyl-CoA dehydrogenase/enoyl-CoA hydratase family protein [Planctomycetes bacterium]|nr:3-hydroxyacyl-CoA dehydrogenase/enoyl-CoA hydratase family protein [Planctomycetota bacterium]